MPAIPALDLRSQAKDHQRFREHSAKWSRGARAAVSRPCTHEGDDCCTECARRPARHGYTKAYTAKLQAQQKREVNHKTTAVRRYFRGDVAEALGDNSDSSGIDDIPESSAARSPDVDIMYSFDAPSGPSQGSQILSHALFQAVQRFENKETEKIVKEYDLVLDGKDELEFADTEDDFEIIDAAQLK